MQPNVVWIGNQKGGVGKTTLTAQLGGLLAVAGWRVLLVDLDPQGNLARHVGVIAKSDEGRNLFAAVTDQVPLEPLRDVRPGLDLVPAGEHWSYALGRLSDLTASGRGLEPAFAAIVGDYDIVLLDTPPTAGPVHEAAGLLAHYMVVVTAMDPSSIDGLAGTFQAAVNLRTRNPWLEVLGVVVFGVPTQATAWRRRVHSELQGLLGEDVTVFETSIRGIPTTAASLQQRGLLVTEGEQVAEDQVKQLFQRLRKELGFATPDDEVRLSTKSVGGLTDDYMNLAQEIQARFTARLAAYTEQVS